MKTSNRLLILVLVIFTAFASIGCAKKKASTGSVKTTASTTNNNNDDGNLGDEVNDTSSNICQASCAEGQVEVTSNGKKICLPKSVCSECYGYYKGYCYQGTNAYQWYYGQH
jgi:hypothetical protein